MSFLKYHLDNFLDNFPRERHLSSDPVQFVHRYDDPRDREIAGLIASSFAILGLVSGQRLDRPPYIFFGEATCPARRKGAGSDRSDLGRPKHPPTSVRPARSSVCESRKPLTGPLSALYLPGVPWGRRSRDAGEKGLYVFYTLSILPQFVGRRRW